MTALSRLSVRPNCLSCLRRALLDDVVIPFAPTFTQIRGKRKMKKRPTINVRLLKDIKGFGPKGSIVPVVRGLFRNYWLPRGNAEYLPPSYGVNGSKAEAERDPFFGREEEEVIDESPAAQPDASGTRTRKAVPKLIDPEQASELLEDLLPPTIVFERALISPSHAHETTASKSQQMNQIYGSVSTADMADAIRDTLATTEGKDIPVSGSDITILPTMDAANIEGDKLKRTGEFMIEVEIPGGEPVMRNVSIRPAVQSRHQGGETQSRGAGRVIEEGRSLGSHLQQPTQP